MSFSEAPTTSNSNNNNGNRNPAKGLPGFLRRTLRVSEPVIAASSLPTSPQNHANALLPVATKALSPTPILPSDSNVTPNHTEVAQVVPAEPAHPSSSNHNSSLRMIAQGESSQRSYKETMLDKIMAEQPVLNLSELKRLGWNGISPIHRPKAWKLLLGYLPTNVHRRKQTLQRKRNEYQDAVAQFYNIPDNTRTFSEQETLRQVLVDVPRTAPDTPLFRRQEIRLLLSRLLYVWAMKHPASSYVQGINDLATPLLIVFLSEYAFYLNDSSEDDIQHSLTSILDPVLDGTILDALAKAHGTLPTVYEDEFHSEDTPEVIDLSLILDQVEADVYWCLTNLLSGIQDHYTSDQPGVQRMIMRLEELVKRIDDPLIQHFQHVGIEFIQFAFKWMNCLLLREFTLPCVIRLWDTYFSEGEGGFEVFHVYVCAAFLCHFSADIRGMGFDEAFAFLQNLPTTHWTDIEIEILLSQAFVLSTLFHGSDAHLTPMNK